MEGPFFVPPGGSRAASSPDNEKREGVTPSFFSRLEASYTCGFINSKQRTPGRKSYKTVNPVPAVFSFERNFFFLNNQENSYCQIPRLLLLVRRMHKYEIMEITSM